MMSLTAQSPTTSYLTVRLASEYYALPGTSVREIMRWRTPTPVPGAPPVIPGLINQRGQILTVIDARLLLGLAAAPPGRATRLIWIQHNAIDAALLVDAVIDLITITSEQLTSPPVNLAGSAQRVIQAVYQRDDDQPIAILDPSALLILVQEAL
ncbi:MAG: chemotaxis protein CheW [Chloroflexus sp.]|jgi:purine-binding chemotaxis protein CheW|nr:chemotaxis protein CheW [Chloroflexus sp.]MBO9373862.1 chemotaxis protein CheW [Chloroflexus sp.]